MTSSQLDETYLNNLYATLNNEKTKLLNILRLMFLYRPFEVVLTYFTSDSIFGSFISKIPPNHYQYKNPSLRKAKRNGIHYNLDISDIIDWYIYYGFREKSKELLLESIKENDTVIDVGANVGEISLRAANIVKYISSQTDSCKISLFFFDCTFYSRNSPSQNPL